VDFEQINKLTKQTERTMKMRELPVEGSGIKVGVDLGTCYIVLVVLDDQNKPVACEMELSQVVRDGLVVDYIAAVETVRRLKSRIEERTGIELKRAAAAIPPGTTEADYQTHRYVIEGAGMEVVNMLDEPTAANSVLGVKNGAVVDIGGGTTGIAIFKDGKVVYTADEPTGGTHVTLVLAGNHKIRFEQAEELKKSELRKNEVLTIVTPVFQKMGQIIKKHIARFDVDGIYLVGGTCCLEGMENIIKKEVGVEVYKPENPLLITPLGIAMNCEG
jgi:ethanolamine utilization protein EutJ